MMQSCSSNGEVVAERDRVSCLPVNVMEHILSFLPLREAVKTSLLSSEWRDKWTCLPALVFDDDFTKLRGGSSHEASWDVLYALKLHIGPVRELSLSISQVESCLLPHRRVDQILHSLDRAHLESLHIDIGGYPLGSCVYSFGKLRKLHLSRCKCTSSVIAFDSFTQLTHLELRDMTLTKDVRVSFGFNCPLLSDLTMDGCGDCSNKVSIVIEAPSLDRFRIVGSFTLLDFKHTPLLKRVSIHQRYSIFEENGEESDNLCKFVEGLPAVEHLSVSGYFAEYLKIGVGSKAPEVDASTLTHLMFPEMWFGSYKYIWSAFSLLNVSENLEQLFLNMSQANSTPEEGIERRCSTLLGQCTVVYGRLKRVKVNQLCGTRVETAIIRWLLDSSPKLEMMEIEFLAHVRVNQTLILKELIELPRASPTARIKVK